MSFRYGGWRITDLQHLIVLTYKAERSSAKVDGYFTESHRISSKSIAEPCALQ